MYAFGPRLQGEEGCVEPWLGRGLTGWCVRGPRAGETPTLHPTSRQSWTRRNPLHQNKRRLTWTWRQWSVGHDPTSSPTRCIYINDGENPTQDTTWFCKHRQWTSMLSTITCQMPPRFGGNDIWPYGATQNLVPIWVTVLSERRAAAATGSWQLHQVASNTRFWGSIGYFNGYTDRIYVYKKVCTLPAISNCKIQYKITRKCRVLKLSAIMHASLLVTAAGRLMTSEGSHLRPRSLVLHLVDRERYYTNASSTNTLISVNSHK